MPESAHNLESWICERINRHQQIAYAIIDRRAAIIAVSDLMQEWFVKERKNLTGRAITELLPPIAGWEEDFVLTASASQEIFTLPQLQMVLSNGSEGYFDLQIERMPEVEANYLVLLTDVTKQTRLQQMLQQQRNELQLYIQRLEETARERDQLIEDLDAFSHTVAHELKNPTTAIIGYSDLLNRRFGDFSQDIARHFLQLINKSGRRMTNMIDELLLLANVQGREVEPQPVKMVEAVSGALERLQLLVDEAEAEIIMPQSWPVVIGYTRWIEEIWTNYVSNAIKYGGRPARVELGHSSAGPNAVKFWVKDNGAGLNSQQQAQLFSKFTRLADTKIEGHGLGLSIVKRIAAKLGGEVGVESRPGEGSTFYFTLPLCPAQTAQPDPVAAAGTVGLP